MTASRKEMPMTLDLAFVISLMLATVGVTAVLINIPMVTERAFWFVTAAYVVLALENVGILTFTLRRLNLPLRGND
jgi:hypothetical protein